MEEFEAKVKAQWEGEVSSRDEQIAVLEQEKSDADAYWQEQLANLQAEKDAMQQDYESRLATWVKKRGPDGEFWENPVTGETAWEDKTIKNEREIAMEAKLAKNEEKMRKMTERDRAGNVKQGANVKIINNLRTEVRSERSVLHTVQRIKIENDLDWTSEMSKLEDITVSLNEELERWKAHAEEAMVRHRADVQEYESKLRLARLQSEERRSEAESAARKSAVQKVALQRELRRTRLERDRRAMIVAECETRLYEFNIIKKREFDILLVKLRKARDSHQDDLEALARLWPVDTGFVLPTMLKPYADVLRIERERQEREEKIEAAGERPLDKLDTDSEDEEAYMHREDMIEEITRLRKEAISIDTKYRSRRPQDLKSSRRHHGEGDSFCGTRHGP